MTRTYYQFSAFRMLDSKAVCSVNFEMCRPLYHAHDMTTNRPQIEFNDSSASMQSGWFRVVRAISSLISSHYVFNRRHACRMRAD